MLELDPSEQKVVDVIVQRCRKYNTNSEVTNNAILKELGKSKAWFHPVKNRLIAKHVLQGERRGCRFTDEAVALFLPQPQEVIRRVPMEFPVLGQVKAGRTPQDNLRVYMTDPKLISPEARDMRVIPGVEEDSDVFLLEVVGNSMVDNGIHEGDYLLVKPFKNGAGPRQGQLIVARYVLAADHIQGNKGKEKMYADDLYEGPTVKYYTYDDTSDAPHRLMSHLKDSESKVKIHACEIEPVGYVVGQYRDYKVR
jgi:SOS-response transcriptional repressor LexA